MYFYDLGYNAGIERRSGRLSNAGRARYDYNNARTYVSGLDQRTTYPAGMQQDTALPPGPLTDPHNSYFRKENLAAPHSSYMQNDNLAAYYRNNNFTNNAGSGGNGEDTLADIKSVDADSINETLLVNNSKAKFKTYTKSILKNGNYSKAKNKQTFQNYFVSRKKKTPSLGTSSFAKAAEPANFNANLLPVISTTSYKPVRQNILKVLSEYTSHPNTLTQATRTGSTTNPSTYNSKTRLIPLPKPGYKFNQQRDMPISSGFGGYTNTTRRKPAPKPQPVKQEIAMAPRKPVKVQPLYRVNSDEDLFRPKTIIVEDEPEEEVVHVVHRQRQRPKEKIIYVEDEAPQQQTNVVYVDRPASPQIIYQKAQSPQVIFSQPPAPLVIQQPTPQIVYANAQPRQQMATAPQQIVYMNEPPVQYVYQAPEQPFAQNIGGQQVSYYEQNPLVYVNDQIPIANANVVTTVPSNAQENFIDVIRNKNVDFSVVEYLQWMFKERTLDISTYFKNQHMSRVRDVNRFFNVEFVQLGADLHAATYTINLGGKARFNTSQNWISRLQELPKPDDSLYLDGLDLSKTVINVNGLSNIEHCANLKALKLRECPYVDNWLLSRISHLFSSRLQELDVSGCQLITDEGLKTLAFLNQLRKLNIDKCDGAKNRSYIAVLLEENEPHLEVTGYNHDAILNEKNE